MSYPNTCISDGQAEHAGHLAVVGEFEAGTSSLTDEDFVENKLVLLLDVNSLSVAKLFRGELTAVVALMVFLEDRGHV